jgi:hypothetical protein
LTNQQQYLFVVDNDLESLAGLENSDDDDLDSLERGLLSICLTRSVLPNLTGSEDKGVYKVSITNQRATGLTFYSDEYYALVLSGNFEVCPTADAATITANGEAGWTYGYCFSGVLDGYLLYRSDCKWDYQSSCFFQN